VNAWRRALEHTHSAVIHNIFKTRKEFDFVKKNKIDQNTFSKSAQNHVLFPRSFLPSIRLLPIGVGHEAGEEWVGLLK
jgi:hypothetical protein